MSISQIVSLLKCDLCSQMLMDVETLLLITISIEYIYVHWQPNSHSHFLSSRPSLDFLRSGMLLLFLHYLRVETLGLQVPPPNHIVIHLFYPILCVSIFMQ